MNLRPDPDDDRLLDWLAEYDQALAGDDTQAPEPPPAVDAARLAQLQDCVRRLHDQRRAAGRVDTPPETAGDTGLTDVPLSRLGRFEVRRLLGGGGFGLVYLAFDRVLRREVAVKVPRPEALLTPGARERFLREGRTAAALDHPNLVRVLEAGADGVVAYLVSEFCPGPTLDAWLSARKTPVPVNEAARMLADLAAAVTHIHQHQIIHRDLKPANILLVANPEAAADAPLDPYVPRITDFGLARDVQARTRLTQYGALLGTPTYMAPEQARGQTSAVAAAADIYALGTILYELLTGRPPLEGPTDLDTLRRIVSDDPLEPRRLRGDVPRDLETICLKCLRKEPRQRYASAAELRDDLRRFRAGEPIHVRPVSAAERLLAWLRRRPAVAGLFGVSAAALLGFVMGIVLYIGQLNQHAKELEEASARERREREHAQRIVYASRFKLAQQYLEKGQLTQAVEMLDDRTRISEADLRGFEWYYLKTLCHPLYTVWRGHTGGVTAVAVSPDGRTVATDGHDHTVRLWDRATGGTLAVLKGHQDALWGLSFLEDGRALLAVGDKEIWQWDIASREKRASWPISVSHVETTVVTANGQAVAWAHDEMGYSLWSTTTGKRRQIRGEGQYVAVAFAPDARTVALGCRSGKIEIRDVATDDVRVLIPKEGDGVPGHKLGVWSLAFSPDGKMLASGSHDTTIRLWDAATGAFRSVLTGHDSKVQDVLFAPDGRTLVSASWRDEQRPAARPQMRLWDTTTGQPLANLDRFAEKEASLAFTPDGRHLVMGCGDHTVRLLDTGPGPKRESRPGHAPKEAWAAAFSPDGRLLATAGDDAYVRLWDTATGRSAGQLQHGTKLVTSLAFFPDGQTLASAGFDGTVRLWDVEKQALHMTFVPGGVKLRCLAVSPDGQTLAAGTGNGSVVRLLRMDTGQVLTSLNHGKKLRGLAFTSDGATLATVGEESQTQLWDTTNWKLRGRLSDTDKVGCVAFTADGSILATGNKGGQVRLWDLATRHERATLKGHHGEVFSLAFAPNGKTLATAGADGTVRLWQTLTGEELLVLDGHPKRVNTVAFTADGRTLVSADHAGTVVLWRAPDPTGKGAVPRTLEDYRDVAFGQNGMIVTAGDFRRARANAVAVQPDGKVVVAGYAVVNTGQQEDFLVLRYLPDGALDTTFGRDGMVITDFAGGTDIAYAVAVQPDGKILAGGRASNRFALVRYNPDGSPDRSFNADGKVIANDLFDGAACANALALQPDGKIILVGEGIGGTGSTGWDFAVARFHANGTPDTSFGKNGKGWTSTHVIRGEAARAMVFQADGRILAAGECHHHAKDGTPLCHLVLARYLSNGDPDPQLAGGMGVRSFDTFSRIYSTGLAVQDDGKLLIVGVTSLAESHHIAVLRLLSSGDPDQSFGNAGKVVVPFSRHQDTGAARLALRPDGRILVAGFTGDPAAPFALLQLDRDGRPDSLFGKDGRVGELSADGPPLIVDGSRRPPSFAGHDWSSGLALQSDGKIVVCGHAVLEGGRMAVLVARYRADGRLDSQLHMVKPAGTEIIAP